MPLVTEDDAAPWCERCEWNLGRYRGDPDESAPVRAVNRWLAGRAFRLASREYRRLAGRPVRQPAPSLSGLAVLMISVLLWLFALACLVGGVWLVVRDFPSFGLLLGVPLIGIAVLFRPRLGRLSKDAEVLRREQAPTLFALVDRAAVAAGSRPPAVLAVDADVNAYTTQVGMSRRRVLCLGLPLWAALTPQQRVALLGHELGHFVNGDVRRGYLTQPVFTTLGTLAYLFAPGPRGETGVGVFAELVIRPVQWLISRVFLIGHLLLLRLAARNGQQAEYYADEIGARLAGTDAAVGLTDTLLVGDLLAEVIPMRARAGEAADGWRAAADRARERLAERRGRMRQLSVRRTASLFATHPPAGLRARMLESRPGGGAAVTLTGAESARIDEELGRYYESCRRALASSI